jgi:hypothetical protein
MAPDDPEGGFKIIDRRRRGDLEEPVRPVTEPRPAPTREPPPGPAPAGAERSLVGLFMMLGNSAMMSLGETPDPSAGPPEIDLPAAADIIDVLLLLSDKTEGRRSAEETQVLDELLYELQLRYVAATKQSG